MGAYGRGRRWGDRYPPAPLRKLLLASAFAVSLAVPAYGFLGPKEVRGDLDADGQLETVRAVRVDLPDVDDQFDQTAIEVSDQCGPQGTVTRRIAGPQDNLVLLRLKRADTRPGREVFADLRSGAAGRLGEARLVAWRNCQDRQLFAYRSDHHTRTPRGGNGDISAFFVRVRNITKRYRGLEIALNERFNRPGEPTCCASISKLTYWRYSRARDRYVRYRTKLRHFKPVR
jgi:hypothetical protein